MSSSTSIVLGRTPLLSPTPWPTTRPVDGATTRQMEEILSSPTDRFIATHSISGRSNSDYVVIETNEPERGPQTTVRVEVQGPCSDFEVPCVRIAAQTKKKVNAQVIVPTKTKIPTKQLREALDKSGCSNRRVMSLVNEKLYRERTKSLQDLQSTPRHQWRTRYEKKIVTKQFKEAMATNAPEECIRSLKRAKSSNELQNIPTNQRRYRIRHERG